MTELIYEKTWLSSADFPAFEDSEEKVRHDLMYHPEAIRSFINESLIPETKGLIEEKIASASVSPLGSLDKELSHNSDGFVPTSKAVIGALETLRGEISALGALDTLSGSYSGSGGLGVGAPCEISLPKAPVLIIIFDISGGTMLVSPLMSTAVANCGLGERGLNRLSFSEEERHLSFYAFYSSPGSLTPAHQMNERGKAYYYLALLRV